MKRLLPVLLILGVATWSCGGSKKGSTTPEKELKEAEQQLGSETEVPDVGSLGGPGEKASTAPTPRPKIVKKKISKGLTKKFQAVLKEFYEAGNEGWSSDKCEAIAKKFAALTKEAGGEKIATFYYNAGVTYTRCGMKDKAKEMFEKTLSVDKYHGGAQVALMWLRDRNVLAHLSKLEQIFKQPGNLADPDVNFNLALAYYLQYKKSGRRDLFTKLLTHLRRAIATVSPLEEGTAESVRAHARVYGLVYLAYLEAAKRGHANIGFIKIFRGQVYNKLRPCTGEDAVQDQMAKMALAQYHNANGLAYLRTGMIGKAFDEFKDALACHPEDFAANLNLGMMGIKFRQPELAIKSLELILSKYPNVPEAYEASLALAVAYKVNGMRLYDMFANSFDAKERLQAKMEYLKLAKKKFQEDMKQFRKVVDGKLVPPAVKEGKMTMQEAKKYAQLEIRRRERAIKKVEKEMEKVKADLELLAQPDVIKQKAIDMFRKARAQYEKVMAKNASDPRVVFDLAALYYDAADLVGGDKIANYRKARSLFKKYLGMKGVPRARKKIAEKYIADLDELIHGLEELKNQESQKPAQGGSSQKK